jgi:hypothetical protein
MNEQAADKKIKGLLDYVAVIINCWIDSEKRTYYINYLYSRIID